MKFLNWTRRKQSGCVHYKTRKSRPHTDTTTATTPMVGMTTMMKRRETKTIVVVMLRSFRSSLLIT